MRISFSFLIILICGATYAQDIPGVFPQASQRLLTTGDLEKLDVHQLLIMRNEVFARYGHMFKNQELKDYFAGQPWYAPKAPDVTGKLTDVEKKNVKFILDREERIKATSNFESFYQLFDKLVRAENLDKLAELANLENFNGLEHFKEFFWDHLEKIKSGGLRPPQGEDAESVYAEGYLDYSKSADGIDIEFVVFKKRGCCWTIHTYGAIP